MYTSCGATKVLDHHGLCASRDPHGLGASRRPVAQSEKNLWLNLFTGRRESDLNRSPGDRRGAKRPGGSKGREV